MVLLAGPSCVKQMTFCPYDAREDKLHEVLRCHVLLPSGLSGLLRFRGSVVLLPDTSRQEKAIMKTYENGAYVISWKQQTQTHALISNACILIA